MPNPSILSFLDFYYKVLLDARAMNIHEVDFTTFKAV